MPKCSELAGSVAGVSPGRVAWITDRTAPEGLPKQIARMIIAAAAQGEFLPGERLPESGLAARLDVSRVPVREAFRLLQSRDLVTTRSFHATRLITVTARDVRELVRLRGAFEREALQSFRDRSIDPGLLAEVRYAVSAGHVALQRGDLRGVLRADRLFHLAVSRCSGNHILCDHLDNLMDRQDIFRSLISQPDRFASAQEEHAAILQFLEVGELKKAEELLMQHLDWIFGIDLEEALETAWLERQSRQD